MANFYLYLSNILIVITVVGLFIFLAMQYAVRDGRGLMQQSLHSIGGALLARIIDLPTSAVVPEARHLIVQEIAQESTLKVGHVFPLRVPITGIGRGPHNHITLEDPMVSGTQAALSYENGAWWVEDQESRNGTFLYPRSGTAKRVRDRPERLDIGDVIQIGDTRLRLTE